MGGRGGASAADATTAIPVQRNAGEDPPTRAMPVSKPRQSESDAATEKLNAQGQREGKDPDATDKNQRRGGGVSAQDLLRREGRRL